MRYVQLSVATDIVLLVEALEIYSNTKMEADDVCIGYAERLEAVAKNMRMLLAGSDNKPAMP